MKAMGVGGYSDVRGQGCGGEESECKGLKQEVTRGAAGPERLKPKPDRGHQA